MEVPMMALAIVAIAVMLGLLVVVVVDILQEAAAGCKNSIAVNASKGRCFHP